MSLSRRVGRAAAGQLAGRLYTSFLAFLIAAVVLPRALDEPAYGVFAWYHTLFLLLTNLLDFGAGTIVIREASKARERAGALIGQLVWIKAGVAALGVVLVAALALVFEGTGARLGLVALAALHLLAHAPAGLAAIFHVDMTFGPVVWANVLGQTAWLAGTGALVLAGVEEPAAYLLAFAAGPTTQAGLSFVWARPRVTVAWRTTREALAALWRQSWPAGVSMTMASLYFYLDTAMLRPLVGEQAVAHYSAAYRLMTFLLMVPVLVSQVIFPVYARLWAEGPGALEPFYRRTLRLFFSVGVLVSATLPVVAEDVMALVFPPAYGVAAPSLVVLSLAVVAVFCAYPHVHVLLAAGHQRTMMVLSAVAAGFNVLANLWAIPRFGIEGAAWTTVATEAWVCLGAAWWVRRRTGLSPAARDLARPAACALGAALVLAWAVGAAALQGPLAVVTGVVAALVALALSGFWPLGLEVGDGRRP